MTYQIIGPAEAKQILASALEGQNPPVKGPGSAGNTVFVLTNESEPETAADADRFLATKAAIQNAPRLVLQIVSLQGLVGGSRAQSAHVGVALSRILALDLSESGIKSHAIAIGGLADLGLVADLAKALASNKDLPSGQVFSCHDGQISIYSQPRPIRTSSRSKGDWTANEINAVANDLWFDSPSPGECTDTIDGRELDGKVAIVTGGGGGIGQAICRGFAQRGASVIVNDIGVLVSGDSSGEHPAAKVAEEIRANGGNAIADTGDVASVSDNTRLIETALDTFGRLDVLINAAGIIRMAPIDEMTESTWAKVLDVNLYGPARLSGKAAEAMIRTGGGSFVHLTSASGLIGSTNQANYAASKLGLVGLSKELTSCYSRQGIRSNCLAPSSTSRMTELTDNARRHLMTDMAYARLKAARAASMPDRIVPLISWLASDLSAAISGKVFGARASEIYLYSSHRPIRTLNVSNEQIENTPLISCWLDGAASQAATPLEVITDVFNWSPVHQPNQLNEEE